ncbi:MAG: hypothetical protein HC836_10655 [Richelia sp. RM2_1_2]|nr:hypothetical protein [Richelia sp. RM2_1_2]
MYALTNIDQVDDELQVIKAVDEALTAGRTFRVGGFILLKESSGKLHVCGQSRDFSMWMCDVGAGGLGYIIAKHDPDLVASKNFICEDV